VKNRTVSGKDVLVVMAVLHWKYLLKAQRI
jgi:hypothetical protein